MTGNAECSQFDYESFGWSFLLRWTLLSALGYALSFLLAFVAGWATGGILALFGIVGVAGGFILAFAVGGVLIGCVVGIIQWLILRRYVPRAGWWILASAVGSGVSFACALALAGAMNESWALGGLIGGVVGGAAVGVIQWLLLRYSLPRANLWVAASAVGWAVGMLIMGIAMGSAMGGGGGPAGVRVGATGILAMAVVSGITGGALMWLVRESATAVAAAPR